MHRSWFKGLGERRERVLNHKAPPPLPPYTSSLKTKTSFQNPGLMEHTYIRQDADDDINPTTTQDLIRRKKIN